MHPEELAMLGHCISMVLCCSYQIPLGSELEYVTPSDYMYASWRVDHASALYKHGSILFIPNTSWLWARVCHFIRMSYTSFKTFSQCKRYEKPRPIFNLVYSSKLANGNLQFEHIIMLFNLPQNDSGCLKCYFVCLQSYSDCPKSYFDWP